MKTFEELNEMACGKCHRLWGEVTESTDDPGYCETCHEDRLSDQRIQDQAIEAIIQMDAEITRQFMDADFDATSTSGLGREGL